MKAAALALSGVIALSGLPTEVAAEECALALRDAAVPKYALKFCHIFPDESCCSPAQDAEIEDHFFTLLDAGDICAKESSLAKDALKEIFCFGCAPTQPTFVNQIGDENSTTFEIPICPSLWNALSPTEFDDCGMVMVEERGNDCAGDDVVVPSLQWNTTSAFLNSDVGAKPPFFEDDDETTYTLVRGEVGSCYDGSFASATVASLTVTLLSVLVASASLM